MARLPMQTTGSTERWWYWQGLDRAGQHCSGRLQAVSITVARVRLGRLGYRELRLRRDHWAQMRRVRERDITLFVRQLATMLRAGVPLLQACDIVSKGYATSALTGLVASLRADLESGLSLAEAFWRHPRYFDPLFCQLVAAGELGGVLETVLEQLAGYREKLQVLRRHLRGVLVYPATVLGAGLLIAILMLGYVIPTFKQLFADFGADLPWLTQALIALSDLLRAWCWPLLLVLILGGIAMHQLLWRAPTGRLRRDRCLLRLPGLGGVLRGIVIARWARTLALLFAAGVPLVEALDAVAGAAGNRLYEQATRRIRDEVDAGHSLNGAMRRSGLFPATVLQMAVVGEETGALDAMLVRVAECYEQDVDTTLSSLSSLLEPAIMLVLGAVIAGLVLAMYWPIFTMGQVIA